VLGAARRTRSDPTEAEPEPRTKPSVISNDEEGKRIGFDQPGDRVRSPRENAGPSRVGRSDVSRETLRVMARRLLIVEGR